MSRINIDEIDKIVKSLGKQNIDNYPLKLHALSFLIDNLRLRREALAKLKSKPDFDKEHANSITMRLRMLKRLIVTVYNLPIEAPND
jgi:hypothetical protein